MSVENANMTTISFTDKHLDVIRAALHTYYRLKSMQVGIALDEVYSYKIDYDGKEVIEDLIRQFLDCPLDKNAFYSFNSPEIGDGRIAGEIEGIIRQYQDVQAAGGYWDNAYIPLKASKEPWPIIQNFQDFESFPLKEHSEAVKKLKDASKYKEMWDLIESVISLPKCEKAEVLDSGGELSVICHKPKKN